MCRCWETSGLYEFLNDPARGAASSLDTSQELTENGKKRHCGTDKWSFQRKMTEVLNREGTATRRAAAAFRIEEASIDAAYAMAKYARLNGSKQGAFAFGIAWTPE